jgi:hypothetical protein
MHVHSKLKNPEFDTALLNNWRTYAIPRKSVTIIETHNLISQAAESDNMNR